MRVVVITGGIGSGKSVVSRMLEERGVPVYDCDSRVKALYGLYPDLKNLVVNDLFSDADALERLETALFPCLMEDFRQWGLQQKCGLVGMESATILTKPFFDGFGDYVLYVDAPEEVRLERALSRGGIPEESVRQRMILQGDCSKSPRITHRITNDSDIQTLGLQIDNFIKSIDYGNRKS